MATVTVTETGVRISVRLTRDAGVDTVSWSGQSITNNAQIEGRITQMTDITSSLTPAQLAAVAAVLDLVEAKAKTGWNIP